MDREVSIARCESYEPAQVKGALTAALAPLGGLDWVKPGMKIAIKANLMTRVRPERAATVHPAVAVALCELLAERQAQVVLGDSPGGPFNAAYVGAIYASTGMNEVRKTGASLNDDFTYMDIENADAVAAKSFQVTRYLAEADAIIDLCKLKTHGLMAFTGACKNFFGAVPGMHKSEYHYQYQTKEAFADMLVDICEWCKPRLCIADGVVAMEGNGPSGGTPRRMGALLAARNPHALDLAAAHLMGLGAKDVPTLAAAHMRGLIPGEAAELHVFGELANFAIADFQHAAQHDIRLWGSTNETAAKLLTRLFANRPVIESAACVGCGECKSVCPAQAIQIINKRARIRRDECVRCFCCQEFCPKGVIRVSRPLMARLMGGRRA